MLVERHLLSELGLFMLHKFIEFIGLFEIKIWAVFLFHTLMNATV